MSLSASISLLSDDNFFNWTFEITQLLRQKNLWEHINYLPPKQCFIDHNQLAILDKLNPGDLNLFADKSAVPVFRFTRVHQDQ